MSGSWALQPNDHHGKWWPSLPPRLPLAFFSSSSSPGLLPGPGTYDPPNAAGPKQQLGPQKTPGKPAWVEHPTQMVMLGRSSWICGFTNHDSLLASDHPSTAEARRKVFVWESFGRCTCLINELSRNQMLRDPIFHVHDRQEELVMTSSACLSRCVPGVPVILFHDHLEICLGSLKMESLLVPLYTTCK